MKMNDFENPSVMAALEQYRDNAMKNPLKGSIKELRRKHQTLSSVMLRVDSENPNYFLRFHMFLCQRCTLKHAILEMAIVATPGIPKDKQDLIATEVFGKLVVIFDIPEHAEIHSTPQSTMIIKWDFLEHHAQSFPG